MDEKKKEKKEKVVSEIKEKFAARYRRRCEEKGIQYCGGYATTLLGCTKANISSFARCKSLPSTKIVMAAADMLNVSTDYLLGLNNNDAPYITKKFLDDEVKSILSAMMNNTNDEYDETSLVKLVQDVVRIIEKHKKST